MAGQKQSSIVFAVGGRLTRADIPLLSDALGRLLDGGRVELVICDVGGLVHPDAVAIDALARLTLTARRRGCRLRLRHASSALLELIAFTGLRAAMSPGPAAV